MHKLIEYVCDELDALERKADKEGKLSMAEIQYGDTLAHMKKNLLKADEMSDGSYGMAYAYEGTAMSNRRMPYNDVGRSYAKRDARGRYSRDGYSRNEDFKADLMELMENAPNDHVRQKIHSIMSDM